MEISIFFALISLLFAGINDAVFKKQAIGGQCKGQYMSVIGLVWLIVFSLAAIFNGQYMPDKQTVCYSLVVGIISAAANYLLIYSMNKLDASVASTIYRLNMALAVFIAFFILHEDISVTNIFGIALAILAVLFFTGHHWDNISHMRGVLCIAILASMLRACMGIGYKIAMNNNVDPNWFLAGSGLCWAIIGVSIAFLSNNRFMISRQNLHNGLLSGVLVCGIVYFFALALKTGKACIVIPIAQMSFVVTALISFVLFKEKISYTKIIGLFFAIMSIILLSQS